MGSILHAETHLRSENSASPIDHYDTFVRLAHWAIIESEDAARTLEPHVCKIAEVVDDERVRRLAFLYTNNPMWIRDSRFGPTDLQNSLLSNAPDVAASLALSHLAVDPSDFSSWLVLAQTGGQAPILGSPESFGSKNIDRLRRLLSRTEDPDDAIIQLLKDGLNYRLTGLGTALEFYTWAEISNDPEHSVQFKRFLFTQGSSLSLGQISCSPTELGKSLADKLLAESGTSLALADQALRADLPDPARYQVAIEKLPVEVELEALAARALRRLDYAEAISYSSRLDGTADRLRSRRAKQSYCHALLATERIPELVSLIAKNCVLDDELSGMLPVPECARRLDKATRRELARELSVPVVLDLFSKRYDSGLDDLRSYAYEDFLLAHGLSRPSELDDISDKFDRDLLIYYLQHICIPDVMQVSSAFQGTRELEDERKSVLSLLVKLNPSMAKDYEMELRDVARAQLISRGVRHVERSKIYVDVPTIRRAFEKAHRETFQRYLALRTAGIGTKDVELDALIENALSGKSINQQALEVPKNEANDLLLEMVRWLFLECTSNPEHGLDCYLSMRIRHGTLSGQLRTPLEVERIITQRAVDTDEYGSNVYWRTQLAYLDEEVWTAIDARLARFSAEYDARISALANDLIQIRSSDKPNGLFNVALGLVRFRLWISDLPADVSFEAFFDRLIELFWESVEDSLVTVRSTIDEQIKPSITRAFGELEDGIRTIAGLSSTSDLDRAVRTAHTGTLQALDIVKDWFRLSQPVSEPDFPIGDLIDVGLQCVTAIHRDFTPKVERHVDPLPPIANALVLFSDIFFIIFDNIRRHSGMGAGVSVKIRVEDKGDRLNIVARNSVADAIVTDEAILRIAEIRRSIADGAYQRAVRSEGGTGLIKLRRLIGPRKLNFDFENGTFFVELELAKREIQL